MYHLHKNQSRSYLNHIVLNVEVTALQHSDLHRLTLLQITNTSISINNKLISIQGET
jgi:hypothetical protein